MNILRAHQCRNILTSLCCVDTTRIAAHGFSMGAFVTCGLVGTYPAQFKAASQAGGGIGSSLTSTQLRQLNNMTVPYQIHHGVKDTIIPFTNAQRLDSLLTVRGIRHQLCIYPTYGHMELMLDSLMLGTIKAWFIDNRVLDATPMKTRKN